MIDLADAEALAAAARHLLAERKRYARISERALSREGTPKQVQKDNADLNWQAMAISKAECALHAACVDGGAADLRDARHYEQREFRPSGWHCYPYTPPHPRAFVATCNDNLQVGPTVKESLTVAGVKQSLTTGGTQ